MLDEYSRDFFVYFLFDFPLAVSIFEHFDKVVSAIMTANRKSHTVSAIGLNILKIRHVAHRKHSSLRKISQKYTHSLLILGGSINYIVVELVHQQLDMVLLNEKRTIQWYSFSHALKIVLSDFSICERSLGSKNSLSVVHRLEGL